MSGANNIVKAQLRELDATFKTEINRDQTWVDVQFNPETLKVSYANQIQQPQGGGDQGGGASQQFVGSGSTKLGVQLWFDVASDDAEAEDDVRKKTAKVAYFITPQPTSKDPKDKKFRPPVLRFVWGSFLFDGIVESMEESLEYFSPEGRPLRASVTLTVTQQKIQFAFNPEPQPTPPGVQPAGTAPMTTPPPGQSLQQMHSDANGNDHWQPTARANGVDNPRFPPVGRPIDLSRRS